MLPTLIGLTGMMGAGKTPFIQMAHTLGAAVIMADDVAKRAIYQEKYFRNLRSILGEEAFVNGDISLPKVREILFATAFKRAAFEAFTRPIVREAMQKAIFAQSDRAFVLIENAILFEKGWDEEYPFERIVVVHCSKDEQAKRLQARGIDANTLQKILSTHLPIEEKLSRQRVIPFETNFPLAELPSRVESFWKTLILPLRAKQTT